MSVDEALMTLKEHGYKTTGKRAEILGYFDCHSQYVSGKELIVHLQKDSPGLSYDTVYRNLALFSELGILEETEFNGEKKYQLCATGYHHHHLICLSCGKTKTVDGCPIQSLPAVDGFQVTDHKFEIYGYCKQCQP